MLSGFMKGLMMCFFLKKEQSQRVRDVVEQIKNAGKTELL